MRGQRKGVGRCVEGVSGHRFDRVLSSQLRNGAAGHIRQILQLALPERVVAEQPGPYPRVVRISNFIACFTPL